MTSTEELLKSRYGTGKTTSRSQRRIVTAGASVLLVAFLVWAGFASIANTEIPTGSLRGFTVIDQWHSTAVVTVSTTTDKVATCAIQAQNKSFAIVGYKEVRFKSSDPRSREITINTTEEPVSVSVHHCW